MLRHPARCAAICAVVLFCGPVRAQETDALSCTNTDGSAVQVVEGGVFGPGVLFTSNVTRNDNTQAVSLILADCSAGAAIKVTGLGSTDDAVEPSQILLDALQSDVSYTADEMAAQLTDKGFDAALTEWPTDDCACQLVLAQ